MDTPSFGHARLLSRPAPLAWDGERRLAARGASHDASRLPLDAETLRRCAWEIGEQRPADAYVPAGNHVGLAAVDSATRASPTGASCRSGWSKRPGSAAAPGTTAGWSCVFMMSPISNSRASTPTASRTRRLPGLCGQRFFQLPAPGHVPAGRSRLRPAQRRVHPRGTLPHRAVRPRHLARPIAIRRPCSWMNAAASSRSAISGSRTNFLRERRRPKLRHPLRIAAFAFDRRTTRLPGALRPRAGRPATRPGPRGPCLRSRLRTQLTRPRRWTASTIIRCRYTPTARRWRRPRRSPAPPRMHLHDAPPSICSIITSG